MGKKRIKVKIGDVFQISLPNGKYAYGRTFRDAGAGFYKEITDEPGKPPIGSRNYMFIIAFQDDVVEKGECPIVGYDPFENEEEAWAPPTYVYDGLFKVYRIYHKGEMRNAKKEECEGLETTIIWRIDNVIDRIMGGTKWKEYQDMCTT